MKIKLPLEEGETVTVAGGGPDVGSKYLGSIERMRIQVKYEDGTSDVVEITVEDGKVSEKDYQTKPLSAVCSALDILRGRRMRGAK